MITTGGTIVETKKDGKVVDRHIQGGVQHKVTKGDFLFIPEGVPHRFINASGTEGMKILWTYARVDATRTLVETGETRPVLAEHKD